MVYITSDLFGPNVAHEWQQDNTPSHWQTMTTHDQHAAGLGKRKRQVADDRPQTYERTCTAHTAGVDTPSKGLSRQHRSSLSRDSTRLHHPSTPPFEHNNNLSYAFLPSKSHEHSLDRRPVKQLKRVSPKASLVKSTSHLMDVDLDTPPQPSHAVSDLRSCHACQKAPKRKKDLENYMDCRRCEGRTCFICARQCVGCSKAICKKCIVEVGEDGDAWCLDCYSRNINS
ncbi:uncharacterized protein yc1106_04567 [Curvularia clavata]|uniref:Uncharacterized protein n=1 Tax=Curvularia clavata TaxID=95742 RepID=A0A9Q8ZAM5_CURCL|nr:uncharacterized protein yc1106_04567 [Curvularia clavata]